ncbi:adenylate cyclase type 9-like, partial [Convolutriloba macropyga]|uniref:adenylate cyclase type 9-like n=1 Tax=Convolutriloba macropyga TaxID=536237 RepID=UPI003F51F9BD
NYMGSTIASDLADTHYEGVCFIVGLFHLYIISGLPGLICFLTGITCSAGEIALMAHVMGEPNDNMPKDDLVCLIGVYIAINFLFWYLSDYINARKRSLFLREGHQLLSLRQLEKEKGKFEDLLKTTMPKSLALDVIKQVQSRPEDQHKIIDRIRVQDKVSIIFADIVGFTRMSSGKSASQLVELLSDLFGRFDDLCEFTGCEKMATLGDCYYCVCGCPDEVPDHAARAIDMGLLMVEAIARFDID